MLYEMILDKRDEWPEDAPIGTYDIDSEGGVEGYPGAVGHITFVCPNKRRCSVLIGPNYVAKENKDRLPIWAWNGNINSPTLSPSINCQSEVDSKPAGGCGWHGHIISGMIG